MMTTQRLLALLLLAAAVMFCLAVFGAVHAAQGDTEEGEADAQRTATSASVAVDGPRLLVYRNVDEFQAVQNRNFTIITRIFNIGTGPAFDVTVIEDEWPASDFVLLEGSAMAELGTIAPNTNVTHTLVVRPKTLGNIVTQSVKVTYKTDAKDELVRVAWSTELPPLPVLTGWAYDRLVDKHYDEWFFTVLFTALVIGGPYLAYLWANSQIALIARKKATSSVFSIVSPKS